MNKAIFLDKDGTLIYDTHYSVNPRLVRLTRGAIKGLKQLYEAGFLLIVVTNQQGIALGYYTQYDLIPVKNKIEELLIKHHIRLHGFYYCPHHEKDHCICRKPQSGMFQQAALDHGIALDASWVIGDILTDIEAGKQVGCKTILFDKGSKKKWDRINGNQPNYIAKTLTEAAEYILTPQEIKPDFPLSSDLKTYAESEIQ